MPNWVTNDLCVTGPAEDLARFYTTMVKDGKFDFNGVIPMPDCIRTTTDSEFGDSGQHMVAAVRQRARTRPDNYPEYLLPRTPPRHEGEPFWISVSRYLDEHPEVRKDGEARLLALDTTGYADWYHWSTDHWGTKWNACDTQFFAAEHDPTSTFTQIRFDTAWSPPTPVYEALAKCFPTLTFEVEWEEECEGVTYYETYYEGE